MATNSCDENTLNTKYTCCICSEIFKRPVSPGICNHVFCYYCLLNHMTRSSTCPVCRSTFSTNNIKVNNTLQNEITKVAYLCKSCNNSIFLKDLNEHFDTCQKTSNNFKTFDTNKKPLKLEPNRSTFTCPYCFENNLDAQDLIKHCNSRHTKESQTRVVCPICKSMPWGDPNLVSIDFLRHLNMRHKFEYDTYVDYAQDEDAMIQAAINASLQSN